MSYQATVYRVMIASPTDVTEEREIFRDVIRDWNAAHSRSRSIVLLPVSSETDCAAEMGDRPQAILNRRMLQQCDLLVGAFWTRIGTPTGEAVSGTVEEIERHMAEGRPVMLYFSSVPVVPESIDREQYDELRKFKGQCTQRGLLGSYGTREELRRTFATQLAFTMNQNPYFSRFTGGSSNSEQIGGPDPAASDSPGSLKVDGLVLPKLKTEERELLIAAARDRSGRVLRCHTLSGLIVQAEGRNFVEEGNPRSEARWEGAVFGLCDYGLLREQGSKGEVYGVTDYGFEVADKLQDADG